MPAAAREARTRWAVRWAAPTSRASGKWTDPIPRSSSGSTAQASAVRRVSASSSARVGGAQPGRPGDQVGVLGHGGGVLDPAFAAVEGFAGVDGDQTAGRVEDVGDGPLAGVGVPDGVGQHGRDALLGGEADRPGGQAQRAGPGAGAAVVDGLQAQVVPVDLPPGREQARGPVRAARGEGPAHFGAGAEQDVHAARAAQLLPGQERDAGCAGCGRR